MSSPVPDSSANRQAELVASYGSFNTLITKISFGDHSERLAYYGSFSGYRTI